MNDLPALLFLAFVTPIALPKELSELPIAEEGEEKVGCRSSYIPRMLSKSATTFVRLHDSIAYELKNPTARAFFPAWPLVTPVFWFATASIAPPAQREMAPLRRRVPAVALVLAYIILTPAGAIDSEALPGPQPPPTTTETVVDVAAVDVAATTATAAAATTATTTSWWKPTTALTFNYQLGEDFDIARHVIAGVAVYAIDWETPATTVAAMKARGLKPVCYFSAGTFEDWRPDKADFPPAVIGNALGEWPGESWLDVRSAAVRAVMAKVVCACLRGVLGGGQTR